jgi:hypothetical protein
MRQFEGWVAKVGHQQLTKRLFKNEKGRTRMTQIWKIYTDVICDNPYGRCYPCSIPGNLSSFLDRFYDQFTCIGIQHQDTGFCIV